MTVSSPYVLLINPNSSEATTEMMLDIAQRTANGRLRLKGATADQSPPMIINDMQLKASAKQVIDISERQSSNCQGIIVSAYGDPGVVYLRETHATPVIGICEASMIVASQGGRRFAVATVTPELAAAIEARAVYLGLGHLFTGIRCTPGDPQKLAGNSHRLREELAAAVELCIMDGAEAVIIGGGPLGEAAEYLRTKFDVPIIAPISSAVELMVAALENTASL
jgi:Asp/Glu/hydantoin racemase